MIIFCIMALQILYPAWMTITSYGIDTVNNITNQIISDVSILYYILSGLILKHLVNHHILFVHYSWVRSFLSHYTNL